MKKLDRKKIAFLLACASISSGKIQAENTNKAQSPETVAAVGGRSLVIISTLNRGLAKIKNWE